MIIHSVLRGIVAAALFALRRPFRAPRAPTPPPAATREPAERRAAAHEAAERAMSESVLRSEHAALRPVATGALGPELDELEAELDAAVTEDEVRRRRHTDIDARYTP